MDCQILIFIFVCLSLGQNAHIKRDKHSSPTIGGKTWTNVDWNKIGLDRIIRAASPPPIWTKRVAKNVILFLGDGMGLSTIASARVYKAQRNSTTLAGSYLVMETLPFAGLSKTYSVDKVTADSASTSTAYLSGIKANMGTIGVNEHVQFANCSNMTKENWSTSIAKHFMMAGRSVGIVTTSRVTHASPAGVYAHVADRDWEVEVSDCGNEEVKDIARQLVDDDENLHHHIKVILGGGSSKFIPVNEKMHGKAGHRKDKRNLIEEWKKKRKASSSNYSFVEDKNQFDQVDPKTCDHLLGLFSHDNMNFDTERDESKEPSLSQLTEKAIQILSRNNQKGFFLFVEGARIDHAHHKNLAHKAIKETLAFDQAIERALQLTSSKETLIVVTADHSHVFTLGGYGSNTHSVLGLADEGKHAKDGKPHLQLQYANGPGYEYHRMENGTEIPRKNLTYLDTEDPDFRQDAGVWLNEESHGGEDVPIFASGPMSHLLQASEEQTFVAHLMMAASCLGQYQTATFLPCSGNQVLSIASLHLFVLVAGSHSLTLLLSTR